MRHRTKMNKHIIRLSLLMFSIQLISCTEEIPIVPQSEEAQAASVLELKLWAKYPDGTPITDISFTLQAFPMDKGEVFQVSGNTDKTGLFALYLDSSREWSHVLVSTSDDRFIGKVELNIPKDKFSLSHIWVARGN